MRWLSMAICPIILSCLIFCSCIGPAQVRDTQQTTIVELDKKDNLIQNIALFLSHTPETTVGRKTGERFLEMLMEAMHDENRRLHLVSERDGRFPDFLKVFGHADAKLDVFSIADVARRKGYQGFLVAQILDLRARSEEKGILWWRKARYYCSIAVVADLYDPMTAAKMVSLVEEKTFKINASDYHRYFEENATQMGKLDKVVAKMAEALGEQIADYMADQPWKTTIIGLDDGAVILAAGGRDGFKVSDQLDIYSARRVMDGPDGQRFIVPGYKVGRIRIDTMEGRFMRAMVDGQADIKVGDIAVIAKR